MCRSSSPSLRTYKGRGWSAYQTVRKISQPPPDKKIGTTRDDVKCTKVSRSSYITETNLSQHHGKDIWVFDTAATSYFFSQKNFLQKFQPVNNMRMTVAVGGVTYEIKGIGTVRIIFQNEEYADLKCEPCKIAEYCRKSFKPIGKVSKLKERIHMPPKQNRGVERYNYTSVDAIKVMLNWSGLSTGFWSEAFLYHTYVWNRVCHGNQSLTPFELYSDHKPSVKHLKSFGSTAYLGVPKQLRKKLDMRAKKEIILSYALKTRGYHIWLPNERGVVESINVSFNEDNVLEPISRGEKCWTIKGSHNVISNSDTETEEETEHQSSPKISKPESSEQEGPSNNSNSSVNVT
ncbi:retrovirus-related Pol polyprotein from transposon TNT 1-94 [Trichonephila clavipes]|nr:retrovirus-related Pol polyprotein from transposon TNT 1-94 [Trichonephila clavipes]